MFQEVLPSLARPRQTVYRTHGLRRICRKIAFSTPTD